jgi:hypothetical protein
VLTGVIRCAYLVAPLAIVTAAVCNGSHPTTVPFVVAPLALKALAVRPCINAVAVAFVVAHLALKALAVRPCINAVAVRHPVAVIPGVALAACVIINAVAVSLGALPHRRADKDNQRGRGSPMLRPHHPRRFTLRLAHPSSAKPGLHGRMQPKANKDKGMNHDKHKSPSRLRHRMAFT